MIVYHLPCSLNNLSKTGGVRVEAFISVVASMLDSVSIMYR